MKEKIVHNLKLYNMGKDDEKWIENLPYEYRSTVKNFSEYAKGKIKEKIDYGYKISQADYFEIEVVKGFSYYGIDRSGSVYAK